MKHETPLLGSSLTIQVLLPFSSIDDVLCVALMCVDGYKREEREGKR